MFSPFPSKNLPQPPVSLWRLIALEATETETFFTNKERIAREHNAVITILYKIAHASGGVTRCMQRCDVQGSQL
jgi:hypothetical protein